MLSRDKIDKLVEQSKSIFIFVSNLLDDTF